MKTGIRKPSLQRSIKARTTAKMKRSVKKTLDPTYGKKGMGMIKDPKKAVYNTVYNKTTISAKDLVSSGNKSDREYIRRNSSPSKLLTNQGIWSSSFMLILSVIILLMSLILMLAQPFIGICFATISCFYIFKHFKAKKEIQK